MEQYTIVVIIFGILILLLLTILFFVNNLLLKRQKVDFSFNSIIKCLDNRVEILNKIEIFLRNNTENEEKYITNLNNYSITLSKITKSSKENIKEIKESSKLFQKFINLITVYPKLEKNKKYYNLIEEIKLNEDRLIYAIEIYDKEAKKYNELKQTKINSIISKILKIKDYEYYNK